MHNFDLTPREKEVLALVRQGYKTQGIAKKLIIEWSTACTHVKNIREKLHIKETAEQSAMALLVRAAWERQEELLGDLV